MPTEIKFRLKETPKFPRSSLQNFAGTAIGGVRQHSRAVNLDELWVTRRLHPWQKQYAQVGTDHHLFGQDDDLLVWYRIRDDVGGSGIYLCAYMSQLMSRLIKRKPIPHLCEEHPILREYSGELVQQLFGNLHRNGVKCDVAVAMMQPDDSVDIGMSCTGVRGRVIRSFWDRFKATWLKLRLPLAVALVAGIGTWLFESWRNKKPSLPSSDVVVLCAVGLVQLLLGFGLDCCAYWRGKSVVEYFVDE